MDGGYKTICGDESIDLMCCPYHPAEVAGPSCTGCDGCDSYARYIYIHGTNHEDRIGEPFSAGCVEMLNTEVVELFNAVAEGDLIWICA